MRISGNFGSETYLSIEYIFQDRYFPLIFRLKQLFLCVSNLTRCRQRVKTTSIHPIYFCPKLSFVEYFDERFRPYVIAL